jgi:hypothetical protein
MEPANFYTKSSLWAAFNGLGMYENAVAEAKAFFELRGEVDAAQALEKGYRIGGYHTALLECAKSLELRFRRAHANPVTIAILYCRAGDRQQAVKWLEHAYEDRFGELVYLSANLDWKSLWSEPAFHDLVCRMKLPFPDSYQERRSSAT